MNSGAVPTSWHEYRSGWKRVDAEVVAEALVTINVNGAELVTIMCTPREQDWLALGFLRNEGMIESIDEVKNVHISRSGCCVDVWLNHAIVKPERVIKTSGCGGGVTFDDPSIGIEPLRDNLRVTPEIIYTGFNRLQSPDSLYARSRGVHAAGLVDAENERLLATAEDVGRHNAVDKIVGACLMKGIETRGRILLVTGRVSSEMLRKGALMGCPVIASRTSPTSLSVEMARAWNVTLIGYVRQGSMRVYTHPERLGYVEPVTATQREKLILSKAHQNV
ncbi:MAG: formate dehydrogenase accessory sulfurtransferase FdhD [Chloroflexi bacterium]|nr:formate dehydrogenase accessory sulfurtransferase FdhD [Chloroflexota bacterium]MBU1660777.1 formate dehydrogenase accessory sulfurtransferase FdhD [Chloroflexota bacterium]